MIKKVMSTVGLGLILTSLTLAQSDDAISCPQPEAIDHGLADWDGKSEFARYACFQGYHLVGPPQVECRYGRWYSDGPVSKPTCKPIVCNYPSINNGRLSTGESVRYRSGEEAMVECEEGYMLRMSSGKIMCKEDGSWQSAEQTEFPMCQEKPCQYPDETIPVIENGSLEINGNRNGLNGGYKPGSVALYHCNPGYVLVPLSAGKRVCRKGVWEGIMPACIAVAKSHLPRTHCPAPNKVSNGYFFTDRGSEKPLALPVEGIEGNERYERGTIARYRCKDGYSLSSFHGQTIYKCMSNGRWSPSVPPFCISTDADNHKDPLEQVMCSSPSPIAYADFNKIEGWISSNGAFHGTILEYHCRVGYRDSRTPCLPTRRTCHAGKWVGRLPSCVPFDFCERPPIISHGYMRTPAENVYHVLSEVRYECHSGYRMKGSNLLSCHATGCWMPNELPECIREDLYESGWNSSDPAPVPVVAILISISVGCTIIAIFTTVCLILVCRRKGGPLPPPSGPAHWSTTVTVTPDCGRNRPTSNGQVDPALVQSRHDVDRMALIAFADGVQQVTLPSYEEALRDSTTAPSTAVAVANGNGLVQDYNGILNGHHYGSRSYYHGRSSNRHQMNPRQISSRRSRHPAGNSTRCENNVNSLTQRGWNYSRHQRRRRDHDTLSDSASHHSSQVWQSSSLDNGNVGHTRHYSGASNNTTTSSNTHNNGTSSQSTSLRSSKSSHSANSADTLAGGIPENIHSSQLSNEGSRNGSHSQTPSCRALAGSLASFDAAVVNTEGVPLLEENELLETEGSNSSVSGETGSATYSETS